MNKARQTHEFGPCYDADSKILILGSFPSVKSREEGFYYGHPMNRFWKLLALLYEEETPGDIAPKKAFLKRKDIEFSDCALGCD